MNASTFTTAAATGRRRVTVRRTGDRFRPWIVTIERTDLPALVLPYERFDEACEDVRYLLDLRRRLAGVRP